MHSKMYLISCRTQLTAPNCQPVGKTCVDCTHMDAQRDSWQQYALTCRLSFRPHVYSTLPGLGLPRPSLRTTLASFPQAATKKTTRIPVFTSIPVVNLATNLAIWLLPHSHSWPRHTRILAGMGRPAPPFFWSIFFSKKKRFVVV